MQEKKLGARTQGQELTARAYASNKLPGNPLRGPM